jgi:type IV secretory pathway TrbF-like protein
MMPLRGVGLLIDSGDVPSLFSTASAALVPSPLPRRTRMAAPPPLLDAVPPTAHNNRVASIREWKRFTGVLPMAALVSPDSLDLSFDQRLAILEQTLKEVQEEYPDYLNRDYHNDQFRRLDDRNLIAHRTIGMLGVVAALAVAGCIYLAATRTIAVQPLLIDNGARLFWGQVQAKSAHDPVVIHSILDRALRGLRMVSSDFTLQKQEWEFGWFLLRGPALQYFTTEMTGENNPNSPNMMVLRGISRHVLDLTLTPQTPDGSAWHASWIEETNTGTEIHRHQWSGVVTLQLKDPQTLNADERKNSPCGVFLYEVGISNKGEVS